MYRRECTGAFTGAFADAGTLCSVHCVVCSVLPGTGEDLAVEIVLASQYFPKHQVTTLKNQLLL